MPCPVCLGLTFLTYHNAPQVHYGEALDCFPLECTREYEATHNILWQMQSKYPTDMCLAEAWYGVMCSLPLYFPQSSDHLGGFFFRNVYFCSHSDSVSLSIALKMPCYVYQWYFNASLNILCTFSPSPYFHVVKQNNEKRKRQIKVGLVGWGLLTLNPHWCFHSNAVTTVWENASFNHMIYFETKQTVCSTCSDSFSFLFLNHPGLLRKKQSLEVKL